jgi:chromosome segregation ATPase
VKELLDNPGFVALMGTIFGGAGLKFIESWLSRAKERAAQEGVMRDELRKEIESLRLQLANAAAEEQRLEAQIEEWRGKYYDLRDEKQTAVTELQILKERLQAAEAMVAKRSEN